MNVCRRKIEGMKNTVFCAAQYPNSGRIFSVEQIPLRFALLILHISNGVESTIKTFVKSENFALKTLRISSKVEKQFSLSSVINASFYFLF